MGESAALAKFEFGINKSRGYCRLVTVSFSNSPCRLLSPGLLRTASENLSRFRLSCTGVRIGVPMGSDIDDLFFP